ALAVQLSDGLYGSRLDGVGNGDDPRKLAVDGNPQRRLPMFCQFVGALAQWLRIDAVTLQKCGIANEYRSTFDNTDDAQAAVRLEALDFGKRVAAFERVAHNSFAKRMLAGALKRCRHADDLVLAVRGARRHNLSNLR